jgi:hypothetical protein
VGTKVNYEHCATLTKKKKKKPSGTFSSALFFFFLLAQKGQTEAGLLKMTAWLDMPYASHLTQATYASTFTHCFTYRANWQRLANARAHEQHNS